jgi:hypothetical protein
MRAALPLARKNLIVKFLLLRQADGCRKYGRHLPIGRMSRSK